MSLFRRPLPTLLLIAALVPGMATVAMAAGGQDRSAHKGSGRGKQAESRNGDESLSDSVRRIERETQGQILSAERVQFDGRDIHRVKVVDDRGRVRVYVDDPEKPARSDDDRPRRTRGDDGDTPNL